MSELLTGKQVFLRTLKRAGIDRLFGNPGTTEFPLMDALKTSPEIAYILCLQDAVAVAAAHGYAMVTGKPAAVNLHAAPGVSNALGALYNAQKAGVPLVVTAGQVHTRLMMHEAPLWADLAGMTRQFVKWAYEVKRAEELPWALYRALGMASAPPSGPVFLSLPMNVLDEPVREEEAQVPVKPRLGAAKREALEAAANLLAGARRPLIVSGEGVALEDAVGEAVALAELLGARVYAERMPPRVTFPETHLLFYGSAGFSGRQIGESLARADVIFLIGTSRLVPIVSPEGWQLPADAKVIGLEADAAELGKVFPVDVGMIGDVKETLAALAQALKDKVNRAQVAARTEKIHEETEAVQRRLAQEREAAWDQTPISVARLSAELREIFPVETVVVNEGSASGRIMRRHYGFTRPETYFGIKGAALGWGLPASIGAKIALPERPVVAFLGDGATLYTPQALWTAAHYGVPVTVIVANNLGYTILKDGMRSYLGTHDAGYLGMDIVSPEVDYAGLAESLGVPARRVMEPQELRPALAWAREASTPVLLEVRTG